MWLNLWAHAEGHVIAVSHLTKTFKDTKALDDVTFVVGDGEVFGYLGPNGSGKTTTVRLMLGLLKPTSGEVLLWGRDAGSSPDVRRRVGVLLESDGLYPRLSAYDNMDYFARLYGMKDPGARIDRLLEFAGLSDRRGDKAGTFSRGMRRKLGLIRALLHSPDLLVLDEPTAGLDPEAQKMVRDLILTLSSQSGITVFLNSHDLDEVQRICGRVAILQRGRIRALDTLKALQATSGANGFDLVVADPARLAEAREILANAPGVESVSTMEGSVRVTLPDGAGTADLVQALESKGIRLDELRKARRSLEEVYLDIVRQEEG
jgi:ABC-2 type transport system ATP-binding protein